MEVFLSFLLIMLGFFELAFGIEVLSREGKNNESNLFFFEACVVLFFWSVSYGCMGFCKSSDLAYVFNAIVTFSISLFLISQFKYVVSVTKCRLRNREKIFLSMYIATLVICPFIITKWSVFFKQMPYGLYYSYTLNIFRVLHIISLFAIEIFQLLVILKFWRKGKIKREKLQSYRLILSTLITMICLYFDAIMPLFNKTAFPISVILLFVNTLILLVVSSKNNSFVITSRSMSEYIYQAVSTPVIVLNSSYRIEISNVGACEFLNTKQDKLKYLLLVDLFDILQGRKEIERNIKSKKSRFRVMAICKLNKAFCGIDCSVIYDEAGDVVCIICMIQDKTEEYDTMMQLIQRREEAVKSNNLKRQFLANMSHEIRTPMNAILGMVELILCEDIDNNVRENALNIQNAGKNLLAIVNDILDFSKIESGKMTIVNQEYYLSSMITDVVNIIKIRLQGKNIEFVVNVSKDIPNKLIGDEVRLHEILINLLNNAIKYTKEGKISLTISWKKQKEKAMLSVAVEDTGIGIKKEELDNLFNRFQQADTQKNHYIEGTGLGLSICKQLIELMEGKIGVISTYGAGSTFFFTISQEIVDIEPIGELKYAEIKDVQKREFSFEAPNAKVLAVDDNVVNLKVAQGLMKPYNIQVDVASSGKECLEKIETERYDIVFMDHMMPEMDGIETLKAIRRKTEDYYKNVPVIALTANAVNGIAKMFLSSGFQDYISKPIEVSKLERILLEYLPKEKVLPKTKIKAIKKDIIMDKLNTQKGIEHTGGDFDTYIDILKTFYREQKKKISLLKKCKEENDLERYRIEVHGIKSAAANIGADELSAFAKEHETAARENNIKFIDKNFERLIGELEELLELLSVELEQHKKKDIIVKNKLAVSNEVLYKDYVNVIRFLEFFEKDKASALMKKIKEYDIQSQVYETICKAELLTEDFEYEEAIKLLKDYRKKIKPAE